MNSILETAGYHGGSDDDDPGLEFEFDVDDNDQKYQIDDDDGSPSVIRRLMFKTRLFKIRLNRHTYTHRMSYKVDIVDLISGSLLVIE